jgi:hypothetical protein
MGATICAIPQLVDSSWAAWPAFLGAARKLHGSRVSGALISRAGGGRYGAVQGYEFSKHVQTDQGRSAFGLWPGSSLWKYLPASAQIARAWWPALQITQLPRLMPVRMV